MRLIRLAVVLSLSVLPAPRVADAQQAGKVYRIGWMTTGPLVFIVNFREGMRELGYVSVSVPIVFVTGDPVGNHFVASLARPGGNMTGLALLNPEISAKWIELVRETFPKASRIAMFFDPGSTRTQPVAAESAARERVGAIVPLSSAFFNSQRERIVSLAARHRMPAVYENREFVEVGGLISYGPDYRDVFKRLAAHADKVLKGTKPTDLPVEQPTKFELVINLKTAKALGLTIPQSVLGRADQVIE